MMLCLGDCVVMLWAKLALCVVCDVLCCVALCYVVLCCVALYCIVS